MNTHELEEEAYFIRAQAETSATALGGRVVHPHRLIQVGGIGETYSGTYLVHAVSHEIDPTQHTMRIQLWRNAIGNGGA